MRRHLLILLVGFAAAPVWAGSRTITLSVPGMHCPVCPVTVKKALSQVKGVESANADLGTKTATVTYEDRLTSPTALTAATANAGYPSSVVVKTK